MKNMNFEFFLGNFLLKLNFLEEFFLKLEDSLRFFKFYIVKKTLKTFLKKMNYIKFKRWEKIFFQKLLQEYLCVYRHHFNPIFNFLFL